MADLFFFEFTHDFWHFQVSMENCAINVFPYLAANTDIATTALSAYAKKVGMDCSVLNVSTSIYSTIDLFKMPNNIRSKSSSFEYLILNFKLLPQLFADSTATQQEVIVIVQENVCKSN